MSCPLTGLTEGELWTREQLAELLGRRFSPPAVAAFLVASQRRAGAVRRARPQLASQEARWLAAGAAAYVLARQPARAWAPWWAATALMLDWHLGMVETERGEPRPLGPADALTLARVWMVPLAAADPRPSLSCAAFVTDVLDGQVARATATTRAGRDLEGLADACFAAAALCGAHRHGLVSTGVVATELTRLGVGFGYAVAVWFATAERPDPGVLRAAKVTTPVRAAGLVAAGAGRRRAAGALLLGGCAWSVGAVVVAVAARASSRRSSGS